MTLRAHWVGNEVHRKLLKHVDTELEISTAYVVVNTRRHTQLTPLYCHRHVAISLGETLGEIPRSIHGYGECHM